MVAGTELAELTKQEETETVRNAGRSIDPRRIRSRRFPCPHAPSGREPTPGPAARSPRR
nr:hypothetical protein GCM10020093_056380 [Planobispora longispora]